LSVDRQRVGLGVGGDHIGSSVAIHINNGPCSPSFARIREAVHREGNFAVASRLHSLLLEFVQHDSPGIAFNHCNASAFLSAECFELDDRRHFEDGLSARFNAIIATASEPDSHRSGIVRADSGEIHHSVAIVIRRYDTEHGSPGGVGGTGTEREALDRPDCRFAADDRHQIGLPVSGHVHQREGRCRGGEFADVAFGFRLELARRSLPQEGHSSRGAARQQVKQPVAVQIVRGDGGNDI